MVVVVVVVVLVAVVVAVVIVVADVVVASFGGCHMLNVVAAVAFVRLVVGC